MLALIYIRTIILRTKEIGHRIESSPGVWVISVVMLVRSFDELIIHPGIVDAVRSILRIYVSISERSMMRLPIENSGELAYIAKQGLNSA